MFKKVHLRLTLLFTVISSLILIIMTLCYLYMAEQALKENAFLSFQSDMNTIVTNLENQNTISYEWLSKLESNGKYEIALYDNSTLLSFSNTTKQQNQLKTLEEARLFSKNQIENTHPAPSSPFSSYHFEFPFTAFSAENYYLSYSYLPKQNGSLEALVLFSLNTLTSQISSQRIRFFIIDGIAVFVVVLFSFFFTGQLLKPIEENAKKQTQFIASASHELRTPLAVILSSISAIKKATPDEQANFMKIMEDESSQMSRLVNDMLSLANADNHSWSISKEKTELDTLLLNCYESLFPLASQTGKSLFIELPEEAVPSCFCDKQRLEQVVSILLQNALSYTSDRGTVKLLLTYCPPFFHLSVIDNGIGIADADKPHIFDRFYRADNSRNKKGHFGLGLCIAKEIIDAHHGSIAVTDTPDGGTTFTIILRSS